MKNYKTLILTIVITTALNTAQAQNMVDSVLGSATENYRADDVPAGEQGRYYIPGAAAANDNIAPGSFSQKFKSSVGFSPSWGMSCGSMDFYSNFQAEIQNMKYELQNTVKKAEKAAMAMVTSAVSGFQQYIMAKINPTLSQLGLKNLDKYIEMFEANIKTCQDYEQDVKNGKNPLSEIAQIAVGDQWKTTIGLVNSGSISLEEAKDTMLEEAIENGVTMSDGEQYGGENQEPINITQSLIKAGMNLIMARGNKNQWDSDFTVNTTTIKNNPILKEFKNPSELYEFVEDIYGSIEQRISASSSDNKSVKTTSGRGYEKKYAEYRNEYIAALKKYVDRSYTRAQFEQQTGLVIPPAEIQDIRTLPGYEKAVEIERRGQALAIKRVKDNLLFAKQALKTGIYAPDMQQSSMKGLATEEYKSLYYRMLDDIAEISQRAYAY